MCCYRRAGGGDCVAVTNATLHRTQNCVGAVSMHSRKYSTTDLKRLNKAATAIQVCKKSKVGLYYSAL